MKLIKLNFYFIVILLSTFNFYNCNNNVSEKPSITKGSIKIAVDESLKKLVEAEIFSYKIHYPNTTIEPIYVPEQKAMGLLFSDSVKIAVVTRDFTVSEKKSMELRSIKINPALCALDAITFISGNNSLKNITVDNIKKILLGINNETKLIFDHSNSSNLYFLLQKLNLDFKNVKNIYNVSGTDEVIDYVYNNPNAIGVIGYNWISDLDDPNVLAIRKKINILGIKESEKSEIIQPSFQSLKQRKYYFERFVQLHTLSNTWGIENGFIRFTCSKIGQLTVEKLGLVPFYKIPKEVIVGN